MSTIEAEPTQTRKVTLDIGGMTCAACAARIERVVSAKPGIVSISVNLPLERADIVAAADLPDARMVEMVEASGFTAIPRAHSARERRLTEARIETERRGEERRTLALFILGTILTLPLVAPMALKPLGIDVHPAPWTEFLLATPVQFICGWRFYRGAARALKSGMANMDVLVAIGTTAAFLFSLFMVLRHGEHAHGHLYFEGAAAVITLVLFGKVLEHKARRGTTAAIRALVELRPESARIIRDGAEIMVPIDQVSTGDSVIIHPGERIAVDGIITEGETEVDESLVTGESVPVLRRSGDRVMMGALNGGGRIMVRAGATGEDTTLARITRMVEAAQTGKAPVQRLVDRISAIFVPVVMAIALLAFAGWLVTGADLEQALVAAISVLVIACPCALGLATPAALVAGTGAAARSGILIKDIEILERTAHIDTVLFDKTGTLTIGRPKVVEVEPLGSFTRADVLRLAGAVQAPSEHPLGRAIREAAATEGLAADPVQNFRAIIGEGVQGEIGGETVLAGRPDFLAASKIELSTADLSRFDAMAARGQTVVAVAIAGKPAGLIALADAPHEGAAQACAHLADRGIQVMMVTGDASGPAHAVAERIGIPADSVISGVRPDGKTAIVRQLVGQGKHPAMIGDGINDAPALAAADVGFAMGSGTDAAIETAGIALMRPDPRMVPAALDIATRTLSKIRQNLFWAFAYNVVGIPLAALGYLSPALSGAAMAMSSVSVVVNSLGLRRWRADI